jgi:hypothetical protein
MAWGVPKLGTVAEVASGALTLAEPAGTAQGDLQIACIAIRSTVGFTNADWTKIEGQLSGDTDATNGIAAGEMWYRVRGAAAGTLQFSRTGGDLGRGCILGYTGGKQNATVVLGNHSSNTLAVASATATTGTISTTEATELIVAMSSAGDNLTASAFDATDPSTASGATDTTTAPTAGTWIERTDTGTNTGADGGLAVADAIRANAGATGTIQATISGTGRHVMIASAFRMLVDTAIAVAVGAVTIAGFAPTVTTTENTVAAPAVGVVSVVGFAPTVTTSDHQIAAPGVGAVTVAGFAPTVVIGTISAPPVGAVAVEGFAPTVTASSGESAAPDVGAVTIAGFVPTISVSDHQSASPSVGVVTIAGLAPTVTTTDHQSAAPDVGAVSVVGLAPTVTTTEHQSAAPALGDVTIAGFAPTVTISDPGSVGTGDVTIAGFAPLVTTTDHQTASTATGTVAVAGFAPTVVISAPSYQYALLDRSTSRWTLVEQSCVRYRLTDRSVPTYTLSVTMSQIDCSVDFEAVVYITRQNEATRAEEPASGLTGVTLRISATKGGAEIHSSLTGTATEAASAPGYYVVTMDQPDLAAHLLPSYTNKVVHLVVVKDGDIDTKSFPYIVVAGG